MSANWKNKILNYQAEPPKGVWEGIVKKMDEEEQENINPFAEKLQSFEVAPPIAVWAAIEDELNAEETPVVLMPDRGKRTRGIYWRMGAAAAIIIIIGSIIWSNKVKDDPSKQSVLAATTTPANTTNTPIAQPDTTAVATTTHVSTTKNTIILSHKKTTQPGKIGTGQIDIADNFVTNATTASLTKDPFENNNEKLANNNGSYAINTDLINSPDRYVIVAGPDGSSRRVSSKLSTYLSYLNNKTPDSEEAIDVIIRESAIWKDKFKNWSDKMINSPLSPTLSNFMNVIELSNFLSEKK
jgi:hypothetical protein